MRTVTIAFRLTKGERAVIDQLARACSISTSEYARRSVLEGMRASQQELADATERGRGELRPTIDHLEHDLASYRQALTASGDFAETLQRDLRTARAPADLAAAVARVLAGRDGAKEALALCWSQLGESRRRDYLPIVAATVSDHMDRSLAVWPISERSIDDQLALLTRVSWLAEALALYSVDDPRTARAGSTRSGPVWAAHDAAAHELLAQCELLDEYEAARSARLAGEGWIEV